MKFMLAQTSSSARLMCLAGSLLAQVLFGCYAEDKRTTAARIATGNSSVTVKVAAIQCSSDLGAVEANRDKLTDLVREAADNGAKIVVLPEAAITGYVSQDLKTNWHVHGRPLEAIFTGRDPATA